MLKEFARNRNKVSIRRMDLLIHAPLFKGNYNSISYDIVVFIQYWIKMIHPVILCVRSSCTLVVISLFFIV